MKSNIANTEDEQLLKQDRLRFAYKAISIFKSGCMMGAVYSCPTRHFTANTGFVVSYEF